MKTIKAYLILILTGWRSVEVFGNPKEIMTTYIVCLKNNAVIECHYLDINFWHKVRTGDISDKNPVKYWRKLPASPKERLLKILKMKNLLLNIVIILLILLSLFLLVLGINNIYKGEIISGIVIVVLNAWSLINCYTYFKNK